MKKDNKMNISFPVALELNAGIDELHSHAELEIICPIEGQLKTVVNGVSYQLNEGELCIVNSENLHDMKTQADASYLSLLINTKYFDTYIPNISIVYYDCVPDMRFSSSGQSHLLTLKRKYAAVIQAFTEKNNKSSETIINATIDLLTQLRNWFTLIRFSGADIKNGEQFDRIWDIIEYIYDNCWRRLPLAEVADFVHLSSSYLSHLIKKITGGSYEDLVNTVRAENALKLLMQTDMSITQISMECGFSDPKYFNHYFAKCYGIKPKEYRSQNPRISLDAFRNQKQNDADMDLSDVKDKLDKLFAVQTGGDERIKKKYKIDASGLSEGAYEKLPNILVVEDMEDIFDDRTRQMIMEAADICGFDKLMCGSKKNISDKEMRYFQSVLEESHIELLHAYDDNISNREKIGALFYEKGIKRQRFYKEYLKNIPKGELLKNEDSCLVVKDEQDIYILLNNGIEDEDIAEISVTITNIDSGEYIVVDYYCESLAEELSFFEEIVSELQKKEIHAANIAFAPSIRTDKKTITDKYRCTYLLEYDESTLIHLKRI